MTRRYNHNPPVEKFPIIKFDERPAGHIRVNQGLSRAVRDAGVVQVPPRYTAPSGMEYPTVSLDTPTVPIVTPQVPETKKPSWIETVDSVYDKSASSAPMNLFKRKKNQ